MINDVVGEKLTTTLHTSSSTIDNTIVWKIKEKQKETETETERERERERERDKVVDQSPNLHSINQFPSIHKTNYLLPQLKDSVKKA